MKLTHAPIQKAVFPVAGLGTRFLPATKAAPKEMLSIVNKPLIQYAVEEAYAAGIRQMIFVTCHYKRAIEDHFDISNELENELISHNKMELLSLVHAVKPEDMECFYVRQPKPLGLGHAVLCAESLIGDEAFAVLLADDLIIGEPPIMKQMVDIYKEYRTSVLAVQNVSPEHTSQYGIIAGKQRTERILDITDLVEKPLPDHAPSNIAIVGRYILSASIFDEIRALPHVDGDEIQLTDAIKCLLKKESVLAYRYDGTRYDCGSILGFLKANVDLGRIDPVEGERFSKWLLETIHKQHFER
ncbi:UTP--glucose-1-phosphate uridylyltransferase GalU [Legionella fallonii]|uniref:UTP--glucose-1-phosphate uridylyltransferase n=1 Tax=Legionella fallonii LLAP-10 TaxID=1212491 RepID=A0A098G9L9_9GAMM|nr:UTP--glucose-1-phosphate uridylyltransferase GalU [Legionella fallonii]CEG58690.1 UTP--glucose-1-phosphate uridylyltransferase yngB [Legionella fallonii LLAP-10]